METTAILAIHHVYADAIYNGVKTFEVRKTRINASTIYLYETSPIKLITGVIKIGIPFKLSIEEIKERHLGDTMLTPNLIDLYAKGRKYLWLWPIIKAERIRQKPYTGPAIQSFIYIH